MTTGTICGVCVILVAAWVQTAAAQGPYEKGPGEGMDYIKAAKQNSRIVQIITDSGYKLDSGSDKLPIAPVVINSLFFDECNGDFVKQHRTGLEPAFYKNLKKFMAEHKGQKINPEKMMELALPACASTEGKVSVPELLMTIHNVTRFLARPNWLDPATLKTLDSTMKPVADDLLGIKSIDGGDTLAAMMHQTIREQKDGVFRVDMGAFQDFYTAKVLFGLDGRGLFESLPGVLDHTSNGGAWYYFWLGSFVYNRGGGIPIIAGQAIEKYSKKGGTVNDYNRTLMQLTHFEAGAGLGEWLNELFVYMHNEGMLSMDRKTQSRYCTNNPNVDAPLDLPPELSVSNVSKAGRKAVTDKANELLALWRKRGLNTADLDAIQAWIQKHGTAEKLTLQEGDEWGWWLRALSQQNPMRLAEHINKWMDKKGIFIPSNIRQSGTSAMRALRLLHQSGREVPTPQG